MPLALDPDPHPTGKNCPLIHEPVVRSAMLAISTHEQGKKKKRKPTKKAKPPLSVVKVILLPCGK